MTRRWWALTRGDLDTTIAQVGFNLAQLVIPVFLLIPVGISAGFSVTHLLPGYASGFLIGSLGLVFLAVRLANRENRDRRHRSRVRKQCARDHRVHAIDHAAGLP